MKYDVVCEKTKKEMKISVEVAVVEAAAMYGIDVLQETIDAVRQEMSIDCSCNADCPHIKVIGVTP